MASNVAVAQDPAGNLKPAKDKSTERIDGIVALIMAIGRAMLPEEPAPFYSMLILG
jgi:phage terminase large subunit-like protein